MIPGMKIIDDILQGLPDNARLRAEITKLATENETLKLQAKNQAVEIQSLKDKYEAPVNLTTEELLALRYIDTARTVVHADAVATALSITGSRADYVLERLATSGHVCFRAARRYEIEQKGRDAIHATA